MRGKSEPAGTSCDESAGNNAAATPDRASAGGIDHLFDQAEQALESLHAPTSGTQSPLKPFRLPEFGEAQVARPQPAGSNELDLTIELGRAQLDRGEMANLCKGAVLPLDKLADEPVDIFAADRLIGRGEVLVLNDSFCVRVTELIGGPSPA